MSKPRYRTLADRLLQMRLVPSRRQVKRDVSYEFMNRQMVWHAFTASIQSSAGTR
jgi:peroxin-2